MGSPPYSATLLGCFTFQVTHLSLSSQNIVSFSVLPFCWKITTAAAVAFAAAPFPSFIETWCVYFSLSNDRSQSYFGLLLLLLQMTNCLVEAVFRRDFSFIFCLACPFPALCRGSAEAIRMLWIFRLCVVNPVSILLLLLKEINVLFISIDADSSRGNVIVRRCSPHGKKQLMWNAASVPQQNATTASCSFFSPASHGFVGVGSLDSALPIEIPS